MDEQTTRAAPARVPLDAVKVGDRIRKDVGDIDSLTESISKVGLIQPLAVWPDMTLAAGGRRLEAVRRLGWAEVPIHVVNDLTELAQRLQLEIDENTCRIPLKPTEMVAAYREKKKHIAPAAAERERAGKSVDGKAGGRGKKKKNPGENLPRVSDRNKTTREMAAIVAGASTNTLARAEAVVDAAEANPDLFGDLPDQMDDPETGSVNRAYKEMIRRRKREENRQLIEQAPEPDESIPPTPAIEGVFRTIVIDPPWDWGDEGDVSQFGRGDPTYATVPLADLLSDGWWTRTIARPFRDLAEENAHLYLWITNRSLPKGFALLEAWGFRYVTCLTWCKPSVGMGNYFRGSTEHVLFGIRGSAPLLRADVGTWFAADRQGRHSTKPEEFYGLVESCSPGPWLEMFARKPRKGWAAWGAEA